MSTSTLAAPTRDGFRTPIPFRGGFAPGTNLLLSIAGLGAFLLLWQLAFAMRWVNPVLLPGPIEVARAFAKLAMSGELAAHLAASLSRIAIGWALGVAGGVALGVAIGL